MRPALSVILLTTLIGAGQGLFLALFSTDLAGRLGFYAAPGAAFLVNGTAVSLVFLGAGLVASFFHLGRPERAWRSASQWRTSWLSREVIVLPAFGAAALAYGAAHFLLAPAPTSATGLAIDTALVAGAVGSVLAIALYVCTGMIYACLRFLREWHSPLTVLNYVLMGFASGATLAAVLAAFAEPALARPIAGWALGATLVAFAGRASSLVRNARLRPISTAQTAIGVKHPRIRQVSQGFTAGSFNTLEFFHGRAPGTLRHVKGFFLATAFLVPSGLLAASLGTDSGNLAAAACLVQWAGLMAERWFFFAEANHPQNLYYQAVS